MREGEKNKRIIILSGEKKRITLKKTEENSHYWMNNRGVWAKGSHWSMKDSNVLMRVLSCMQLRSKFVEGYHAQLR